VIDPPPIGARDPGDDAPVGMGFRSRLTLALILAAILPMTAFALLVLAIGLVIGGPAADANLARLLLFGLAIAVLLAVFISYLLAADLTRPLRVIATAVDRVTAGDLSTPIRVGGDDELARLAESHNRLAADLERRNRELGRILLAIEGASPRDGVDFLAGKAGLDARAAFGMLDATVILADPAMVPSDEVVPGEARPLRAVLRVGNDHLGVLIGRVPPTRTWERADQDLLELFASEVAVAIRNAQLFGQVEAQNAQLLELDAAKDDFLRGVSHNLQTPLTSIRAYAEQLRVDRPDQRLGIIAEQSERLSRMVRQLLTVTRLESGALHPRSEVVSLATRVRKAWEALGAADVPFSIEDRAGGWLAVADADQLDQVLWALLDNAVKYGGGTPITAEIVPEEPESRLRLTVSDGGAGVGESDEARLFGRFVRGAERTPDEGSGLGLYVSRELCRAMGGDLFLEPRAPGRGAAFTVRLPAEFAEEA
jgi:signal transduction histidine kinase/HAMP domain-containing protein